MHADPVHVALEVAAALERVGVPYLIGGSVASTVWGEPRATLDVDFVVQLDVDQVELLAEALEADFVLERESMREAARQARHCNLIHLAPMLKVDLHVRRDVGHNGEEMRRARRVRLRDDPEGYARVATPEDTVLQKLRWFREEGEVSDRQWRDVLGVIKGSGRELDSAYLERWAEELEVADLLRRARGEARA